MLVRSHPFYSSGVQTLDMIETTGRVLNNTYLEEKFVSVLEGVSRGDLISQAIERTEEFDKNVLSSMIFIGEESGSLIEEYRNENIIKRFAGEKPKQMVWSGIPTTL